MFESHYTRQELLTLGWTTASIHKFLPSPRLEYYQRRGRKAQLWSKRVVTARSLRDDVKDFFEKSKLRKASALKGAETLRQREAAEEETRLRTARVALEAKLGAAELPIQRDLSTYQVYCAMEGRKAPDYTWHSLTHMLDDSERKPVLWSNSAARDTILQQLTNYNQLLWQTSHREWASEILEPRFAPLINDAYPQFAPDAPQIPEAPFLEQSLKELATARELDQQRKIIKDRLRAERVKARAAGLPCLSDSDIVFVSRTASGCPLHAAR